MLVSVIVCTYNRCDLLDICLKSLVDQTAKDCDFEVIIVDNNSADATAQIASSYTASNHNFSYVKEKKQGLSNARNRGYKEAQGKYVAFIDDDAKAHTDWVENIIQFIEAHSFIKVFGGPYFGFSTVPIPPWFPKEYGSLSLGLKTRPLRNNEWISGTNMIFDKELLYNFRGFDKELGMTGDKISYGEETALLRKIRASDIPIYYVPNICVDHMILPYKLNLHFLLNSSYANGLDSSRIFDRSPSYLKQLANFIITCLKSLYIFATCREPYFKTRIYRSLSPLVNIFGSLLSGFKR